MRDVMAGSGAALLAVEGLTKAFPGVKAVSSADLSVAAGEVLALVGENGAGKSTLIKVVTGAHEPDAGRVLLSGVDITGWGPVRTARAGITAIYQELNLVPYLTVRENLFLGREQSRFGITAPDAERRRAREILARLGVEIDPESMVEGLDIARQQIVEIARALAADARLLIMDEPTAALAPREVSRLFAVLRDLRGAGLGILFISHRLDEVFEIADRVAVMRDGETLGAWPASAITRQALIERMVGRPLDQEFPKRKAAPGVEILVARDIRGGRVKGVSFEARSGEVLGIAGLMGAGRTDLARLLFGADRLCAGEIVLSRRPVSIRSPRDAIAHGICLLTEDRKAQGLVLGLSARDNFALPNLGRWSRLSVIDRAREQSVFQRYVSSLRIRLAGAGQKAAELSGGNQQKLLVARWLENDARVVIFDEPTRGIDVGARYEIYGLIHELAGRGKAVIMISSDLQEILGMSDRVIVMHEGRMTGEVTDVPRATQESLLALAVQ